MNSKPVWKSLYSREKNQKDKKSILVFNLTELSVNGKNEIVLSIRIYGEDRNLYHSRLKAEKKPFTGRKESEIFFKEGDIVEFIQGAFLRIGVVGAAPWTGEQLKKVMRERKWKNNLTDQTDVIMCCMVRMSFLMLIRQLFLFLSLREVLVLELRKCSVRDWKVGQCRGSKILVSQLLL